MPSLASASVVDIDGLFSLFKGEPGTRKSTAALSYPLPQFWLSFDRKIGSLFLPGKKWGVDFTKVDYEDYATWTPGEQKLKSFRTYCPYKTIVIDSITSVGDTSLSQVKFSKSGRKIGELTERLT
jgi:hypothetical protein